MLLIAQINYTGKVELGQTHFRSFFCRNSVKVLWFGSVDLRVDPCGAGRLAGGGADIAG